MFRFRTFATMLALGCLTANFAGCVALNIPSDRFHDHADQGGVFGPWKGGTGRPVGLAASACTDVACEADHAMGQACIDGKHFDDGSLTVDPFDTTAGEYASAKPEEIPWPRFHPLPTRPIFGNYR